MAWFSGHAHGLEHFVADCTNSASSSASSSSSSSGSGASLATLPAVAIATPTASAGGAAGGASSNGSTASSGSPFPGQHHVRHFIVTAGGGGPRPKAGVKSGVGYPEDLLTYLDQQARVQPQSVAVGAFGHGWPASEARPFHYLHFAFAFPDKAGAGGGGTAIANDSVSDGGDGAPTGIVVEAHGIQKGQGAEDLRVIHRFEKEFPA